MKIAAAQVRPVWLDKSATVAKAIALIEEAAREGARLVAFPEAFVSGYPFWLCRTDAAAFGDKRQGEAYARFLDAAVEAESKEIADIVAAARDNRISVIMGMNERGRQAGRGSIYCSILKVDGETGLLGIHRKLVPTHDERLCWAQGDAKDLRTYRMAGMEVGALSCWENWMPMARFTLYGGGEELHVSLWPGNAVVAETIVSAIAREGRVWSLSVHGLLSLDDIPDDFPLKADMAADGVDRIFRGGSSLVAPDGAVVAEPAIDVEGLIYHDVDLAAVRASRQMFDPAGHYHRPDIFQLNVRRERFESASY